MKHITNAFFCFLLFFSTAKAADLKGHVYDQQTGEPLAGVTVSVEQTKQASVTGLDGSFELKKLKPGNYNLVISHLSYQSASYAVVITEADNAPLNINLNHPEGKSLSEVVVASGKTSSEKKARKLEQISDRVMNVVSS